MSFTDPHADVAGYAIGGLEPDERARFEAHLESCAECREEVAVLAEADALLARSASVPPPSGDLEDRVVAAVRRAAREAGAHVAAVAGAPEPAVAVSPEPAPGSPAGRAAARPRRRGAGLRRRPRWAGLALAGAAAVALIAVLLAIDAGREDEPRGALELAAALTGGQDARATVRVTELGIGRAIALRTDDLPVLDNEREFYELWFVGPGDTSAGPNRVSAGTFHPDEDGRTRVRLTAAVVPADYPGISVTREPRDGDPRRTGPEVLGRS